MSTKNRATAAGIHLGISLALTALAAMLVFLVWYPYPYREISGGRELFLIVVAVDVIMGPLMTFTVFNIKKPRDELRRDLLVIAVLQLAALSYGLWTVAVARPVHLIFEIDRFRVVHAIDVPPESRVRAPLELQSLPLGGPTLLAVRSFKDEKENSDATLAALGGVELGAQPSLWEPYEMAKPKVIMHTRPLSDLKKRFPYRISDIDNALKFGNAPRHAPEFVGYIPMVSRQMFWTVLVDIKTAEVIAFVPIDSF